MKITNIYVQSPNLLRISKDILAYSEHFTWIFDNFSAAILQFMSELYSKRRIEFGNLKPIKEALIISPQ